MKKLSFFASVLTLTLAHLANASTNEGAATNFFLDTATVLYQKEKVVFNTINRARVANGLMPLTWSNAVAKQARNHSVDMADGVVPFGHDGFNERYQNLKMVYPNLQSMGENVAWNQGYKKPGAVAVQGWLNSPGHYANIMGDYNLSGIGVAKDAEEKYYFTQIFVKVPSSTAGQDIPEENAFVSEMPCSIEQE